MRSVPLLVLTAVVAAAAVLPVSGQEANGYELLNLPREWREFREKQGDVERVEFIYQDRLDGLLRIKRVALSEGETLDAVVDRDLAGPLKFLPAFGLQKREPFGGGNHTGVFVEFDFHKNGKPALGRNYYLTGADATVWVVQFTGKRDILRPLRNVTDQIARGFKEKG